MKEKKFSIRRCENKALLKSLHKETFPEDDFYEHKKALSWVVWDEDKNPVGFCMAREYHESGQKIMFFARAGLLPCARGIGLHQRLIKVRVRHAKRNGFTKVITYTKMDNITSSRNLVKYGFLPYIPSESYADDDCLYWELDI